MKPPETLYIAPPGKKELSAFSKAHGLRNEYFKDLLTGVGRLEHKGWQLVDNVRWLCNVNTGEYVIVVGGPNLFLNTVAKARNDMPAFNRRNFEQLLAGEYKDGSGTTQHVYKGWEVQPEGFQPAEVSALGHGASLAGLFRDQRGQSTPVATSTLPDFARVSIGALSDVLGTTSASAAGAGDGTTVPMTAEATLDQQVSTRSARVHACQRSTLALSLVLSRCPSCADAIRISPPPPQLQFGAAGDGTTAFDKTQSRVRHFGRVFTFLYKNTWATRCIALLYVASVWLGRESSVIVDRRLPVRASGSSSTTTTVITTALAAIVGAVG